MHTLFDFMTHIKGIEYILALMFIAGYILFSEVLKPKPFATVKSTGKDDLEYARKVGYRGIMKTIGKIAAAPFIGIAYIVMLPFAFVAALGTEVGGRVMSLAGSSAHFGWRPVASYLTGKKHKKESKKQEEKK
jgi:hypothetical protein